jgi:phosphatidylserine synthase
MVIGTLLANRAWRASWHGLPLVASEQQPELVTSLRSEAATAAYRGAPANLAAIGLLCMALALGIEPANPTQLWATWLAVALGVTALRLVHALRWRRAESPQDLDAPMRQYAIGLLIHALLWAALPWLIFSDLEPAGRAVALLAAVGVASVEARCLAARGCFCGRTAMK